MNQSRKTSVQGNGRQNDPYATQRHTMSQPPQNKNSRAKDLIWLVVIIAVTIILTIFFMNKCNNNDTIQLSQPSADSTFKTPDNNVTSSEATQNIKKGEEFVAKKKKEDPNIKTSSTGLSYKILTEGEGTKATNEDIVKVKYKGSLIDGTVFDDSKGEVRQFPISGVIPGFAEGLKLLGKGGKATLYLPGNLAYGIDGVPSVGIGPNEMLIFEIELVEIIGVVTTSTNTPTTSSADAASTTETSTTDASFSSPDLTFFELKGPVKSVSCNYYESKVGFKKSYSFSSNGQLNTPNGIKIKRKNGIISSVGYYDSDLASWMNEEFTTSSDGKVLSETGQGIDGGGTSRYSYNSKGHVTKNTYSGAIEGEPYNYVATYTYKSFDQYGNWTKRVITSKDSYGTETSLETRTITYY